jgi:NADPH-dependent ferric siderophore reductase
MSQIATAGSPSFAEPRTYQLQVAGVRDLTPRMRRIELTDPSLKAFTCLPGQDVALVFARDQGSAVRRRYTIRHFDPQRQLLELDFVMHGDGPGMRWAQAARPGVSIETIGPRGKITLAAGVDWHLFAGDATAVPGSLAMMEALAAEVPARAFLQVDDPGEQQRLEGSDHDRAISWRYEAADPRDTYGIVGELAAADLPAAPAHAYLAGEVGLVQALKNVLLSRGWSPDRISAKAYWNRGRANAGHGEPEIKAS